MGRPVNAGLWASWRDRLTRQKASGRSIAEFCRREGISVASFYQWKRKLAGATFAKSAPDKNGAGMARRRGRTISGDAELRLAGSSWEPLGVNERARVAEDVRFVPVPLPPQRGGQWVELSLNDGTVIRVPSQNVAALEVILATLLGQRGHGRSAEVLHV